MFIQLLLVSFIIKFFSKKIKIKSIIFVFSGLLLLFYLIHSLRESDFEIMSYFQAYFFSGIVAFDNVPITINWEGDNVFRFFYAIAHAINPNIPVSEPIFDYCVISNAGHMTNVYTGLYPFYSDFGYAGIGVFSVLWGSLAGYLYKKAFVSIPFLLLYSILIVYVSLMFFGDFLCANFSLSLQYILFILLLFIPYKFKLEKFSLL